MRVFNAGRLPSPFSHRVITSSYFLFFLVDQAFHQRLGSLSVLLLLVTGERKLDDEDDDELLAAAAPMILTTALSPAVSATSTKAFLPCQRTSGMP